LFWRDRQFWALAFLGPVVAVTLAFVVPSFAETESPFNLRMVILVGLFYPILEELAFRGAIQTFIARIFGSSKLARSALWANVLTSVLFSGLHVVTRSVLIGFLVFIPSLIFGHVREKFGSVLPAIVLHSVYNCSYLACAFMALP